MTLGQTSRPRRLLQRLVRHLHTASPQVVDDSRHSDEKEPPRCGHQKWRGFGIYAAPSANISREAAKFVGKPNKRYRQKQSEGAFGDIRRDTPGIDDHRDDIAASDNGCDDLGDCALHGQRYQCRTSDWTE